MKNFFNLQLFADAAGDSAGSADNAAAEANTNADTGKETDAGKNGKETPKAEEKKYTEAEFDALFNRKYAELEKKKQKELDEAKKLAEMNAQEKAEYELNKERENHAATQKELDEYKRKDALAEMTKTARKMLAERNINVSDEVIAFLVSTDAEKTKAAIDGFSKAYTADVEAAVKERLRGETPKRGTGDSGQTISEIDKRIKKYE
jgi:hypothetical protein